MIRPRPLSSGDAVAILSPASIINPDYVAGAVATLTAAGYAPVVMAHTLGRQGSYSGTAAERLADLTDALTDTSIRAIICSRGGYGAVHLLEALSALPLADDPKWLAGFSDISALHALMASRGIMSVHSSMTRQLSAGPDTPATKALLSILEGGSPRVEWEAHGSVPNRPGAAHGTLRGGNLAVLDGLAGTPFDDLLADSILFIEDIGEPIYKVERMLFRLRMSGVLGALRGLVVGRFTDYRPDSNYTTMEAMIADMTGGYGYPVAFNAPIGHIGEANMPVIHGAEATLRVAPEGASLIF